MILKAENITHIYSPKTPFEKKALDGVSFSIEKGEFVGLIGHTGSGKSTLAQMLNGLLRPSSGKIYLDGEDIWAKPKEIRKVRFAVGVVFQYPEYQLFGETVYADMALGPRNMGLSEQEIKERIEEAADFVGLTNEQLKRSPFELSGGQKRRAAIGSIVAMRPKVLVLDEPTAGLDPYGRERLLRRIRQYHESGDKTVILIAVVGGYNVKSVADLEERGKVVLICNVALTSYILGAELVRKGVELRGAFVIQSRENANGIFGIGQILALFKHLFHNLGSHGSPASVLNKGTLLPFPRSRRR